MKIIRLLSDRLLIFQTEPDEKTEGGIMIPNKAKQRPLEGRVVMTGPDVRGVKRADRVFFKDSFETVVKVEVEGQRHLIMNEEDILAVAV